MWFLWGLLFSVFLFLFLAWCVNYTNRITTKRQMLCCDFEMFGIDILLPLYIGPLQGRGNELHQMVHDHAATLLWRQSRGESARCRCSLSIASD